jgi:hypothetical protein
MPYCYFSSARRSGVKYLADGQFDVKPAGERAAGLWAAYGWLEGRMRVALVWLWWSLGGALGWPWGRIGVALGWLCTPESMPSIWPCGGLVVALGGFDGHDAAAPCRGQRATVPITPAPQTPSAIRIPHPHKPLK